MIGAAAIIFSAAMASGMPIVFVLGITSLVMLLILGEPLSTVPQVMFASVNSFPLMALPFFAISAHFMVKGGTSERLIKAATTYVGHLPGGMALVTIMACMIFASLSGSSSATALAIGAITIPAMVKRGYDPAFSAAVVGSGGTLGILIPPSLNMILYGVIAEESIAALFIAGIIPGIILGLALMLTAVGISRGHGYRIGNKASWMERREATVRALPALALPVIILGGIYGGFVTPTEAAALSVLYAVIAGVWIFREIKFRNLIIEFGHAVKPAVMVMAIITTAVLFGHVLISAGVPQRIVAAVLELGLPTWGFLLTINILLFILGMFLDVVSVMLISLPLLVPLLDPLGVNKVHFGVLMTVNMEMALITPPVGMNLFVVSKTANIRMTRVVRASIPFLVVNIIVLMLITYVPIISTWLPGLAGFM
jgi:C4-dicarboxylate transporter DctM subunit